MKRIFLIVFLSIFATVKAQIASLGFLSGSSSCKESDNPTMTISYEINIAPGGGVWVEWYHLGGWYILDNSVHFTISPGIDTYTFSFGPLFDSLITAFPQDSIYRFRYVDINTETYFVIDTFYTHCNHTFSIDDEFQNLPIIKEDHYNLSGQTIDPDLPGLHVIIYTFANYRQSVKKKWVNR